MNMKLEGPLVSVVIPVYNAERYLEEAISSVLAQSNVRTEIILVDDGSTDGSAAVALRHCPPAKYFAQSNGGPAAALNTGASHATGDYLAFLSADDIWLPQKLEWQLAALSDDPECEMVFGHMQHFYSGELSDEQKKKLHCPPEPMAALAAGTLLIHRASFLKVGLFDTKWRVGEFMDWHARACDLGIRRKLLPQVVSMRRVHGANHTVRTDHVPKTYAAMLKATLDRRGRQQSSGGEPKDSSDS